nr:TIGR03915 family putative DNA repair protein [Tissierella sp.]
MIVYIHDGSFDGLLTSIYQAFYSDEKPVDIVREEDYRENFLLEKIYIETDSEKASKVYSAIENKISPSVLKRVFYTYLSELPESGKLILDYLQLGFKIGADVDLHLTQDSVLRIDNIAKKVGKERHRVTGLLRFKKIKEDLLYARVEPDYNVVALVAPHFKERMSSENFIIHDTKRAIAVFYNKKEWIVKDLETPQDFRVKDQEEVYEDLWKTYFNAISISKKVNPKLQRRNMPMRYWKYLTEKQ